MVKVYSKPGCVQCRFVKNYLAKNGVEFEEVDIIATPGAIDNLKNLGFMGVPVTVTQTGAMFKGFDTTELANIVSYNN